MNSVPALQPRSIDVWNASMDGACYKTVGRRCFVAERTIKLQMQKIFRVVGVSSRTELLVMQWRDFGGEWLPGGKNHIDAAITPHFPNQVD